MNIENSMQLFKGPRAIILPDEGCRFRYGKDKIRAQLKLALNEYPQYKFSAVRFDLQPGQLLDFMATLLAGRMLYCLSGEGHVRLNEEQMPFPEETFVYIGEGHSAIVINSGKEVLQVFSFVFGSSPEARMDLGVMSGDMLHIEPSPETATAFGLLTAEQAKNIARDKKGILVHQLADSGPSFWQAKPSAGWVEVKLAPFTHDVHHYSVLMQTLFPGNAVREHAHNQLNEFFIITKGTARAALDGVEGVCPKGSVIIIGRNVWHWGANAGREDAQNFAIVDPPGVEGALALTGRPRNRDEAWPTDIERSPETGKILQERYGFVIRQGAADAVG